MEGEERLQLQVSEPEAAAGDAEQPAGLAVEAPRMAAGEFASWSAFMAYFAVYQRETFQVYMCKSTTSASTRNRRLRGGRRRGTSGCQPSEGEEPAPRRPGAQLLMPEEVGAYARTFVCTHANKVRLRGHGIRTHRQFRSTLCPVKLNLVAKKVPGRDASDPTAWNVIVTKHFLMHNHPINAEAYRKYPQGRRVEDPHVLETVDALRRAGVKQRQILEYLAERTPHKDITKADVHNLLTRLEKKRTRTNESESSSSNDVPNLTSPSVEPIRATTLTTLPLSSLDSISQDPQSPALRFVPRHDPVASPASTEVYSPAYLTQSTPPTPRNHQAPGTTDTASFHITSTPTTSVVEDCSGSFRLRVNRHDHQNFAPYQQLEERNLAQHAGVVRSSSPASNVDATSLQHTLSVLTADVEERSGSFRLRVNRLESQNLELYRANTQLKAENISQRVELDEAKALIVHLRSKVIALQTQLVHDGAAGFTSDDQSPRVAADLQ